MNSGNKEIHKNSLVSKCLRPEKNFGSGQLIFENLSSGLVDLFLLTTTEICKSYFSTSHKTWNPDSSCIYTSVIAKSRQKCTQEHEGLKCSCQYADDHGC